MIGAESKLIQFITVLNYWPNRNYEYLLFWAVIVIFKLFLF